MGDFLTMILELLISLPFVLGLIYISLKLGGNKLQKLQNGKFIKIIERVAVTKENILVVAKIGEKGYIITSSSAGLQILRELEDKELIQLEQTKSIPQYDSLKDFYKNFKLKGRKDNDEE